MSQYAVEFNEKTRTITLKDEDQHKPNKKAVTHIHADALGEMSEATVRPMPSEHLANYVLHNFNLNYRNVTVVNDTSNERLDKLVKTGEEITDAERTVQVFTGEEAKTTDGDTELVPAESELRAPSEV